MEWDAGPNPTIAAIFDQAPLNSYIHGPNNRFRLEWGPIYYRGRTDGSAKMLIVGQDPAADENVARRILVGDAGQRVQGFLRKLGLTRSYVMVNAILYSIRGQFDAEMRQFVDQPAVQHWRNQLLDALVTPALSAVVAFGDAAQHVVETWPGSAAFKSQGRVFALRHPTAQPESDVIGSWNSQLAAIAAKVAPDAGATVDTTPYHGPNFHATDLARIPLRDFSFGVPAWMGTENGASRLNTNEPLPAHARNRPTILWWAIGDEG